MDFSIASLTPEKSPFSISSAISLVLSMTSTAGTRPPAVRAQQALRHDGLERGGQVAQHGRAHFDRVKAQDAVERLVAVVGVHGGQAQWPDWA